jgi:hypothetical protein
MDKLTEAIARLNESEVAEAVKNLRLALQYHWQHEVDDQEVKDALLALTPTGNAQPLRDAIVSEEKSTASMDRWGKTLLMFMAGDPELRPYVEQAVDDALNSAIKDFGLTSLIVIGAVLVLLKWRPKSFKKTDKGINVEWEDNDVSAVSDLAKIAGGTPGATN